MSMLVEPMGRSMATSTIVMMTAVVTDRQASENISIPPAMALNWKDLQVIDI